MNQQLKSTNVFVRPSSKNIQENLPESCNNINYDIFSKSWVANYRTVTSSDYFPTFEELSKANRYNNVKK